MFRVPLPPEAPRMAMPRAVATPRPSGLHVRPVPGRGSYQRHIIPSSLDRLDDIHAHGVTQDDLETEPNVVSERQRKRIESADLKGDDFYEDPIAEAGYAEMPVEPEDIDNFRTILPRLQSVVQTRRRIPKNPTVAPPPRSLPPPSPSDPMDDGGDSDEEVDAGETVTEVDTWDRVPMIKRQWVMEQKMVRELCVFLVPKLQTQDRPWFDESYWTSEMDAVGLIPSKRQQRMRGIDGTTVAHVWVIERNLKIHIVFEIMGKQQRLHSFYFSDT